MTDYIEFDATSLKTHTLTESDGPSQPLPMDGWYRFRISLRDNAVHKKAETGNIVVTLRCAAQDDDAHGASVVYPITVSGRYPETWQGPKRGAEKINDLFDVARAAKLDTLVNDAIGKRFNLTAFVKAMDGKEFCAYSKREYDENGRSRSRLTSFGTQDHYEKMRASGANFRSPCAEPAVAKPARAARAAATTTEVSNEF